MPILLGLHSLGVVCFYSTVLLYCLLVVATVASGLILIRLFSPTLFSIGRVNPELYALGASKWNLEDTGAGDCKNQAKLQEWVQNYVNVLCINSWQVYFLHCFWVLNTHLSQIIHDKSRLIEMETWNKHFDTLKS